MTEDVLPVRAPSPLLILGMGLLLLFLSACAEKRVVIISDTARSASDHNRRGLKAVTRGDREHALAEFQAALALNGSIEDKNAMAMNLLNIARLQRLEGNLPQAAEGVDSALSLVGTSGEMFGELAFEKARIAQAVDRLPEATTWARKAAECSTAEMKGRALNLLARLHFQLKDFAAADRNAGEALLLNQKYDLREEEGNSWRLLGDLRMERQDAAAAITAYEHALEIDKEMGRSRKIGKDLLGLATASSSAGDEEKALDYYRRCQKVMTLGGDTSGAAEVMERIAELYQKRGNLEETKKLRGEREALLRKSMSK